MLNSQPLLLVYFDNLLTVFCACATNLQSQRRCCLTKWRLERVLLFRKPGFLIRRKANHHYHPYYLGTLRRWSRWAMEAYIVAYHQQDSVEFAYPNSMGPARCLNLVHSMPIARHWFHNPNSTIRRHRCHLLAQ